MSIQSSQPSDDTIIITEKLKQLTESLHEIQKARDANESQTKSIGKFHSKMQDEPGKAYYKLKLKNLYSTALSGCQSEADAIQNSLNKLAEVRCALRNRPRKVGIFSKEIAIRRGQLMKMLLSSAKTIPLYVPRKKDEEPPPLCGKSSPPPNYICKAGDLVCALTKQPPTAVDDNDSNWILAEVVSYNSSTNKYDIDDIDEEQKERHVLSRRRVIPLPNMRANPETNPRQLFDKESPVLALYPQTTCFYRGKIHKTPTSLNEDYLVEFEDSNYPTGYAPPLQVPQRYVIAEPKV